MPIKGYKQTDEHRLKIANGHRGKALSEETKLKISLKASGVNNPMFGRTGEKSTMLGRTGDKHPTWVHGVPHITTLHQRIWRLYGKADHCENPGCKKKSFIFDWSNKQHAYNSLQRSAWQQLCRICHRQYDQGAL